MQGLWSTHRRGKINLNSIPASPTPVATPPNEEPTSNPTPNGEAPTPEASTFTLPTTSTIPPADAPSTAETRPPVSSGKRKIRSSRTGEESSKRAKTSSTAATASKEQDHAPPTTRLGDLGGVEACVEKMLELVAMPLCHPEVYLHTGIQPPRGVLLHGPPGCGKTLLANAMAGVRKLSFCIYRVLIVIQELGVPFISISAPSIVSGMSGESEKTLRDTFDEAKVHFLRLMLCKAHSPCLQRVAPCLLFIDEIDAITPKRESAQREMERRIVAQFLTCMDGMRAFDALMHCTLTDSSRHVLGKQ